MLTVLGECETVAVGGAGHRDAGTLTVAATFMLYWLSLKSGCTDTVALQRRSCKDVAAASRRKAPK